MLKRGVYSLCICAICLFVISVPLFAEDQADPLDAAGKGLKNSTAQKVGDESTDPYVRKAYNDMVVKKDSMHQWWPWHNCQTDAGELLTRVKERKEGGD